MGGDAGAVGGDLGFEVTQHQISSLGARLMRFFMFADESPRSGDSVFQKVDLGSELVHESAQGFDLLVGFKDASDEVGKLADATGAAEVG